VIFRRFLIKIEAKKGKKQGRNVHTTGPPGSVSTLKGHKTWTHDADEKEAEGG
jgi:hypothetical protein